MENRPAAPPGYDFPAIAARMVSGWMMIAGLAIGAALVALGLSAIDPHRYRAEALLAVARPANVSFDERFSDDGGGFPARVGSLRTYPELARSDGVALAVLETHQELTERDESIDDLLERVSVRSLAEGTLIGVEARARTPEAAAELANAWSAIAAARAAALFGSGEDLSSVEAEREAAARELEVAVEELVAFDAAGGVARAEAEVGSLENALEAQMDALQRMRLLQADLAGMRAQAAAGGAPGALLAMAELQRAALVAPDGGQAELRLTLEGLGTRLDLAEIDALTAHVDKSREALPSAVDGTAQRLAEARAELTRAAAARRALERRQLLADERHLTLSRKADELAVAQAATRPELRLASAATPVDRLPLADWGRRALVAALLGALAGVGLAMWRGKVAADTADA